MDHLDQIILIGGSINIANVVVKGPRWITVVSGTIMYLYMVAHIFDIL